MLLDGEHQRLYVTCASSDRIAVIATDRDSVVDQIADSAPGAPAEGSTPNALALSPDGSRLYVAEADNDAVAVFAQQNGAGAWALAGRIPVQWYPTAVLTRGDSLFVLNGKGAGTGPNPQFSNPAGKGSSTTSSTLGQTNGSLSFPRRAGRCPVARACLSASRSSNHWDPSKAQAGLPPFQHVIHGARTARSDQVLGDLPVGDTDTSLSVLPARGHAQRARARRAVRRVRPLLRERRGERRRPQLDRRAYASDYVEKTIPSVYWDAAASFDYDGLNRDQPTDDDANEPANGYLWDLAHRANVSMRNYGEFTRRTPQAAGSPTRSGSRR